MCANPWSRRAFVTESSRAAAVMAAAPALFRLPTARELGGVDRPFLEIARQAWTWIEGARVGTEHGATWLADPTDPSSTGSSLYTYGPGVIPFALELFRSGGDEVHRDAARAGADHLAATLSEVPGAGLYTGLGGIAFVLAETFRATEDERYRSAALAATDLIVQRAQERGAGKAWLQEGGDQPVESNDIVSGTAGVGLALLYMHGALGHDRALQTADLAGQRLLERAIEADHGLRWDMWPGYAREMPNFSHGTAGIAYFLAALYQATRNREYLEAATAGARYLTGIATLTDDGYRVFHSRPGGEDLYYLSWCHGPVGTNRLFYKLGEITGDPTWDEWVARGVRAITLSGIPEARTPGFWENISQCCGNVGVAESFLSLHRIGGDPELRGFVDRLNDDLLGRSTTEDGGRKWTQSEHRVQPDLLVAQTGFMQGAAGVGKYFLHVDAMDRDGSGPSVILPDDPY